MKNAFYHIFALIIVTVLAVQNGFTQDPFQFFDELEEKYGKFPEGKRPAPYDNHPIAVGNSLYWQPVRDNVIKRIDIKRMDGTPFSLPMIDYPCIYPAGNNRKETWHVPYSNQERWNFTIEQGCFMDELKGYEKGMEALVDLNSGVEQVNAMLLETAKQMTSVGGTARSTTDSRTEVKPEPARLLDTGKPVRSRHLADNIFVFSQDISYAFETFYEKIGPLQYEQETPRGVELTSGKLYQIDIHHLFEKEKQIHDYVVGLDEGSTEYRDRLWQQEFEWNTGQIYAISYIPNLMPNDLLDKETQKQSVNYLVGYDALFYHQDLPDEHFGNTVMKVHRSGGDNFHLIFSSSVVTHKQAAFVITFKYDTDGYREVYNHLIIPFIVMDPETDASILLTRDEVVGNIVLPNTPSLVLYDPPGDNSYAEIEQKTTFCTSQDITMQMDLGSNANVGIKLGRSASGSVDIGVASVGTSAEAYGEGQFGIEGSLGLNSTKSLKNCFTFSEKTSTPDGSTRNNPGDDVFIGSSLSFDYGYEKGHYLDNNNFLQYGDYMVLAPNPLRSRVFRKTRSGIEQDVRRLKSELEELDEISNPDANTLGQKKVKLRQLGVWQQALDNTTEMKESLPYKRKGQTEKTDNNLRRKINLEREIRLAEDRKSFLETLANTGMEIGKSIGLAKNKLETVKELGEIEDVESAGATSESVTGNVASVSDDLENILDYANSIKDTIKNFGDDVAIMKRAELKLEALEDYLDENQKSKLGLTALITKEEIDGGIAQERTITVAVSQSINDQRIADLSVKLGAGGLVDFAGSGVSGSATMSLGFTNTNAVTSSEENEKSIKYVIKDKDPEDHLSVLIGQDPKYGVPVFYLDPGESRTSRPYEGGKKIDNPAISAMHNCPLIDSKKICIADIPSGKEYPIHFSLCNDSEVTGERLYYVNLDRASNTGNLEFKLGGSTFGNTDNGVPYTLEQGECADITMNVKKGGNEPRKYFKGIKINAMTIYDTEVRSLSDQLELNLSFTDVENSTPDQCAIQLSLETTSDFDNLSNAYYESIVIGEQRWLLDDVPAREECNSGEGIEEYSKSDLKIIYSNRNRDKKAELNELLRYENKENEIKYNLKVLTTCNVCPEGYRYVSRQDFRDAARYIQEHRQEFNGMSLSQVLGLNDEYYWVTVSGGEINLYNPIEERLISSTVQPTAAVRCVKTEN